MPPKVYDAGLNQIEDVVVPQVAPDRTHVYHLYTIQHPRRDALAAHLNASGVQTAINYPTALPFLPPTAASSTVPNSFPMRIARKAGSCRCRCLRRSRRSSRTR